MILKRTLFLIGPNQFLPYKTRETRCTHVQQLAAVLLIAGSLAGAARQGTVKPDAAGSAGHCWPGCGAAASSLCATLPFCTLRTPEDSRARAATGQEVPRAVADPEYMQRGAIGSLVVVGEGAKEG